MLRQLGFSVGTEELIALVNSFTILPPVEDNLKFIIRSFLVKEQQDFLLFDMAYDAFFYHEQDFFYDEPTSQLDLFEETIGTSADGKGLAAMGVGGKKNKLSHFIRLGDYNSAEKIIRKALMEVKGKQREDDVSQLLQQLKLKLDWHMEQYNLAKIMEKTGKKETACIQEMWINLEKKLNTIVMAELLRQSTEDNIEQINKMFNYKQKTLANLTAGEYEKMKKEVKVLGKKIATRKNRQWKKSKTGVIDLKRTVRNSVKNLGVPLKISRKTHRIARPNILLLCDVSSSVVKHSAFMLLLVYSMEQCYGKIHSFIFIDQIEDISPYFSKYQLEEAIEKISARATSSTSGFSNFGRVFKKIAETKIHLLTPKTKIIILGDAKNNYHNPEVESLTKMADKCAGIYWLNPQPKDLWGVDDSIIHVYAKHCKHVWECGNLEQLKKIAVRINR